MPQVSQGGGGPTPPKPPAKTQPVQIPATIESTHQMVVALIIFFAVGMMLVIFAGESKTTGNTIAGFLALALVVQGITHVNPFVSFLAKHPLTPTIPKKGS